MSEYLEDAWKEFERTGEICNAADGLLGYVSDLRKENQQLAQDKAELVEVLKIITYESSGRYYIGVHGDTDVTDEIGKLLEKHK